MDIKSEHYADNLKGDEVSSKAVQDRMHRFVNLAKAMFRQGYTSKGRTWNACFAVKKSKVIAIGFNDYERQMIGYNRKLKTTYKKCGEASYTPSLHAEVSAIFKLGTDDCSDISFYNIRLNKGCHCCHSAPCLNCIKLLRQVGAKHVYFYNSDMVISELDRV